MRKQLAAVARHAIYAGLTILSFLGVNQVNELLFSRLDLAHGVTWVFMPAGVRLLSTLFFGLAGLEGMFLAGVYLNFHHFMFHSDYRSWSGAIAGSLGPYLASLFAIHWFNLRSRFETLTGQRLLFTGILCGFMSPIFHQAFMWVLTGTVNWAALTAMIIGDTSGIVIVLSLAKGTIIMSRRYRLAGRIVRRWPSAHAFASSAFPIAWRRR